jgi:plasmid stabilization system protein ParE
MNYSMHPEAVGDLRDAASFYAEQAGTTLPQSVLGEFEQSINKLLLHPALGSPWRGKGRRGI